jgi:hypothetical protein
MPHALSFGKDAKSAPLPVALCRQCKHPPVESCLRYKFIALCSSAGVWYRLPRFALLRFVWVLKHLRLRADEDICASDGLTWELRAVCHRRNAFPPRCTIFDVLPGRNSGKWWNIERKKVSKFSRDLIQPSDTSQNLHLPGGLDASRWSLADIRPPFALPAVCLSPGTLVKS